MDIISTISVILMSCVCLSAIIFAYDFFIKKATFEVISKNQRICRTCKVKQNRVEKDGVQIWEKEQESNCECSFYK